MDIKPKRFLVVPADALSLLTDRYVDAGEATEAAKIRCSEEGERMYVLEQRAVAHKDEPPVSVTKYR
jgi:hypothetical protein